MSEFIERFRVEDRATIDEFVALNGLAEQVGVINDNYKRTPEIHDDDIREGVENALREKQNEIIDDLSLRVESVPYEELHNADMVLQKRNEELSQAEKEEKQQYEEAINRDIAAAKELAPWEDKSFEELGELKKRRFQTVFSPQIVELEQEEARIKHLFGLAGDAWPVPILRNPSNELNSDPDEIIELDEFPVDKETCEQGEIKEKVQRRQPEEILSEASSYLGLLLGEEPGTVFTYKQLGRLMYPDKSPDDAANDVSALISNYETQKVAIIGECLAEQNLVLQRGRRTYHRVGDHARVRNFNVILRAVPTDYENEHEVDTRIVNHFKQVDSDWKTVRTVSQAEDTQTDASIGESTNPNSGDGLKSSTDETTLTEFDPSEAPTDEHELPSEPLSEPVELTTQPHTTAPKILGKPVFEKGVRKEWEVKLELDVKQAIQRLEEDGLMEDEFVTVSYAHSLSRSDSYATATHLDNLHRARVFRLPANRNNMNGVELDRTQRVLLEVFKNNQPLLGGAKGRRKQKQAVKSIEKMVNEYVDEREARK